MSKPSVILLSSILWVILTTIVSCKKDETVVNDPPDNNDSIPEFDISTITDTYPHVASVDMIYSWGPYNVHDPSIIKTGDTYYCYSTDVAYGSEVRPGIQIRSSKDLIQWGFVGWVFDELPSKCKSFIQSKGGNPNNGLWAPYIMKVDNEYRLYYSLASDLPRLSVIGLATASSPIGPWTETGIVVTSLNNADIHTNAIDPSVLVDKSGNHWMYYGSSWDGIYIMELNTVTGLAKMSGDKGVRIAHRGFTGNTINGNIEGAEIIYNPEFDMYYLFIAYDWLETKYNVRVSRSSSPEGPFLDFDGADINDYQDNGPMILAPYKFVGHSGWQGVSHPTVFDDGNGQFFIAHQGRPGEDHYYMVLHNREIHWTADGWPLVSPERYAGVDNESVTSEDITGDYERIVLGYNIVPGFAETQVSPDFQTSENFSFNGDGTCDNEGSSSWEYESPWITLHRNNGITEKIYVERGRDWENNIKSTIIMTGIDDAGRTIFYKKIENNEK
jgi:arabinan endo-1,5-alpha-L-arabinosidase